MCLFTPPPPSLTSRGWLFTATPNMPSWKPAAIYPTGLWVHINGISRGFSYFWPLFDTLVSVASNEILRYLIISWHAVPPITTAHIFEPCCSSMNADLRMTFLHVPKEFLEYIYPFSRAGVASECFPSWFWARGVAAWTGNNFWEAFWPSHCSNAWYDFNSRNRICSWIQIVEYYYHQLEAFQQPEVSTAKSSSLRIPAL